MSRYNLPILYPDMDHRRSNQSLVLSQITRPTFKPLVTIILVLFFLLTSNLIFPFSNSIGTPTTATPKNGPWESHNLRSTPVFMFPTQEDKASEPTSSQNPSPIYEDSIRLHPVRISLAPNIPEAVVQIYEEYLQTWQLRWFTTVLQRGELYRGLIMELIEEKNLPSEIFFLAMIESEFNVRAESVSGARGIWQFMENSMAPWLKKNDYVDERFGLIQSTTAALNKLEENYRVLGDWLLAFAAYNQGLGAVSRAVHRTGVRDYWKLRAMGELSEQASRYVPKILAASLLAGQLGRIGVSRDWNPSFDWIQVQVPGGGSLSDISMETGIPLSILSTANAHFIKDRLPPGGLYYLTVPKRYLHTFNQSAQNSSGAKPSPVVHR